MSSTTHGPHRHFVPPGFTDEGAEAGAPHGTVIESPHLSSADIAASIIRNDVSPDVKPPVNAGDAVNILICGACAGTGKHAHGLAKPCTYCGGSGMATDERRQDLVDAISDHLWDIADYDVGHREQAEAIVALLIDRFGLDVTTLSEVP